MLTKNILGREEECHAIKHVLMWQDRAGQHVQKPSVSVLRSLGCTWHFFRMVRADGGERFLVLECDVNTGDNEGKRRSRTANTVGCFFYLSHSDFHNNFSDIST